MIERIVKLTFRDESVDIFLQVFYESRHRIASFEGCRGVELLRDIEKKNVFFTKSKWDSAEHLNAYRKSEFFRETWGKTKLHFSDKAEAWSLSLVDI